MIPRNHGSGSVCAVKTCGNTSKKLKMENRSDVSFHRFPKEFHARGKWIRSCGRQMEKWNPDNCFICSDHFREHDFRINFKENDGNSRRRRLQRKAIPSQKLAPTMETPCILKEENVYTEIIGLRRDFDENNLGTEEDVPCMMPQQVDDLYHNVEQKLVLVQDVSVSNNDDIEEKPVLVQDVSLSNNEDERDPLASFKEPVLVQDLSLSNNEDIECDISCIYKNLFEAEKQKYEVLNKKYTKCTEEMSNIKNRLKKKKYANIRLRARIHLLVNKMKRQRNIIKSNKLCISELKKNNLKSQITCVQQSENLCTGSLFSKIFSECQMKIISETQSRLNCTLEDTSEHSL